MEGRLPEALATLEAEVRRTGRIGADHVLQLRREISCRPR